MARVELVTASILVTRNARRAGRVQVWVGYLFFTRDALKGHTVSKNGLISFFFFFYTEYPQGRQAVSRFGSGIFFFFLLSSRKSTY